MYHVVKYCKVILFAFQTTPSWLHNSSQLSTIYKQLQLTDPNFVNRTVLRCCNFLLSKKWFSLSFSLSELAVGSLPLWKSASPLLPLWLGKIYYKIKAPLSSPASFFNLHPWSQLLIWYKILSITIVIKLF